MFATSVKLLFDLMATAFLTSQPDQSNASAQCTNFYSYVCRSSASRPWDHVLAEVEHRQDEQLRIIFEDYEWTIESTFEAGIKAKVIYDSCRNLTVPDLGAGMPYSDPLQTIGRFPLFETNWSPDEFDYVDVMIKFSTYGVSTLFEWKAVPSYSNPDEYILQVEPAKLTEMHHETADFNRFLKERYYSIVFSLNMDGMDLFIKDVLKIYEELVKVPFSRSRVTSNSFQEITFEEFKQRLPEFDWDRFFLGVFGQSLSDSDSLILVNEDYLRFVLQLFKDTQPRIVANFLASIFIRKYQDFDCLNHLKKPLSDVLLALYKQNPDYVPREREVTQLFAEIKDSSLDVMRWIYWMDPTTKARVLQKISNVGLVLASQENWDKHDELDAKYQNLSVTVQDLFGNINAAWTVVNQIFAENLKTQKVDPMLTMDVMAADLKYLEGENKIVVLQGLMHEKIFNPAQSKVVNFARLGFVIARGIARALDPQFRPFDPQRRYHEWWSKISIHNYEVRLSWIEDYFNELLQPTEFARPGLETIQAHLADHIGLQIAYSALQKWLDEHGYDSDEPSMIVQRKILTRVFFRVLTKTFCTRPLSSIEKEYFVGDGYGPPELRVNGLLRNFQPFSDVFDCPEGSFMNPGNKFDIL